MSVQECPQCHHRYPADFNYCIDDGSLLVASAITQTVAKTEAGSWIESLRVEADRMIRGRLIILNEAELKTSQGLIKNWQLLPETYLRVDLLRFGPTEILNTLAELPETFSNPSLCLCFLKRCLTLNFEPAFLENIPKPNFDSGLYVYLKLMLKWKKISAAEIRKYQDHADYGVRGLMQAQTVAAIRAMDPSMPLRIIEPTSVQLKVS